jgi:hypothetical protein
MMTKKKKAFLKVIATETETAKEANKQSEADEEEIKVDPEIEKAAQIIAHDPLLFKKRLDVINLSGVVGERRNIGMYYCALDSRLLTGDNESSDTLAIKNAGHYGSGKSFTLMMCLQIYPDSQYHFITNASPKSLYHLNESLKHKALIVSEGFQFQKGNANSEFVYTIRSLLSENRICYPVAQKDADGNITTVEKKIEGPVSFVTTTIMERLEKQFEDRLFTIHPDESVEQTQDIITMTANIKAGLITKLDKQTIETWKTFHSSLKPTGVIIPFAPKISDYVNASKNPISTRRAFNRVLVVIQSIACVYQYQRKRDNQGRVLAEVEDYWMSKQLVDDSFRENLGQMDKITEERIRIIEKKGIITPRELAERSSVSSTAISQWTSKKVIDGIISWCNEYGDSFTDDGAMKKSKHSGKAYLKIAESYDPSKVTSLPSPYELSEDPDWNEEGNLLKMYDLELGKRTGYKSV